MLNQIRNAIEYLRRKHQQIGPVPELTRHAIELKIGKAVSLTAEFVLAGH
jgi:hypothetical protein